MIIRLIIVQLILAAGFGAVFLMPSSPKIKESAIVPEWPDTVAAGWFGTKREESEAERAALAKDTQFSKSHFTRTVFGERPNEFEEIHASIVLSGHDMGQSIHRPERCMVSQGYRIRNTGDIAVELAGRNFKVKRLHAEKYVGEGSQKKLIKNLTYYWFVGNRSVTHLHNRRGWIDIKDRILSGFDQRWAFVSLGVDITSHEFKGRDGKAYVRAELTEQAADEMIREFVQNVFPEITQVDKIQQW